jgi:glycosyltransferase involved in cell wall biosynthesis
MSGGTAGSGSAAAAGARSPGRIAFVLGTTSGGTGRHVRMLAAGLTARGAQVAVCGPGTVGQRFGFARAGAAFVPVEIADRPRPARDLAAVLRLRRLLLGSRDGAPGVVHAHGLRAAALAALALRPSGVGPSGVGPSGVGPSGAGPRGAGPPGGRPALVVTLHNAPPGPGLPGKVYALLERIVARRADSVLCVSGDLEEQIRRRGARRYGRAVVPAASDSAVTGDTNVTSDGGMDGALTDVTALRRELGAAGRPLVLAAGRLAPQKGLGTLLDAAARWRDRAPQPLVLIAGDGPLGGELSGRINSERLSARLIGHRDDLPALMAAADVLVLPSVWEGQPMFVQEALRAGRPLVATRVGGVPDLTGEDAALLVPPADPDRLAAAILRVLDDTALAERLSAAARQRGRSLPTEEDAVDAVLAEYRRAGGADSGAS